jgi:K+/H+ antiporter YhaU regulatory subunit KhtT
MTSEIEETPLPGVGVRYSFIASSDAHVSVLHHHSGRHQLFVGDPDDEHRLGALATAYVLLLASAGPLLTRYAARPT